MFRCLRRRLVADHAARNNLEAALSSVAAGGLERGTYRNTFVCMA
jgi:hypothetical protein